jgi:hypothetical protein
LAFLALKGHRDEMDFACHELKNCKSEDKELRTVVYNESTRVFNERYASVSFSFYFKSTLFQVNALLKKLTRDRTTHALEVAKFYRIHKTFHEECMAALKASPDGTTESNSKDIPA